MFDPTKRICELVAQRKRVLDSADPTKFEVATNLSRQIHEMGKRPSMHSFPGALLLAVSHLAELQSLCNEFDDLDDAEQRFLQLRNGIESIIDDLISYGNTLRLDQLELRDAIQALQENWMVRSLQTNDAVKSIVGTDV